MRLITINDIFDNEIISHYVIRCNRNFTTTTLGTTESNEIQSYILLVIASKIQLESLSKG